MTNRSRSRQGAGAFGSRPDPWYWLSRRGRRSVAEGEASKRELRLGSGEKSSIEGFEGGFWCRKLCKTSRGKALSLSFLGLDLVMQGSVRGRQVGQQMHGRFSPSRQGCAMFIRFFCQWLSLDQVIESFLS
jgi:hypothetical protein